MLWSTMRLIFKTSSVTPNFFYVFNLILSFSTCSESFEKICAWELLGANVLKCHECFASRLNFSLLEPLFSARANCDFQFRNQDVVIWKFPRKPFMKQACVHKNAMPRCPKVWPVYLRKRSLMFSCTK